MSCFWEKGRAVCASGSLPSVGPQGQVRGVSGFAEKDCAGVLERLQPGAFSRKSVLVLLWTVDGDIYEPFER